MPIELIREKASRQKIKELADDSFGTMIKIVADIKKEILAAGGDLHADGESLLLENGSQQENLWGANFFPWKLPEQKIQYTALINIRPLANNLDMEIKDPQIRNKIKMIVEKLLLGSHEQMA